MSQKQSFSKPRLWIAAVLLAGLFLPARAVVSTPVVLRDSIKPVEQSIQTGVVNPHRPFILRNALTADESAAPLEFEVTLKMRNFSELQARVARGERISPQEMAARYEPLAADYEAVAAWLTRRGMTITRQDAHHMALFARGKISLIQETLQVSFARVTFQGKEYTSAITAPSVPATLSPLVLGINGLQPHLHPHPHIIKQQVHPNAVNGGAPYLPAQIAQAYNATALYNTQISGSGEAIAIVIDTFPATSDLVSFWQTAGVSQTLGNIQFIQVASGTLPDPSGEETLDVEWSSSIAPGAHVRVYAFGGFNTATAADIDQAYQQVLDDVTNHPELGIHQMSMSYGMGEAFTPNSQMQTDDQYFLELANAGVTVFASSGDDGSTPGEGGTGDDSGPLNVENPASDPNVTAVGGTTLKLDANNNETSEVVWNVDGGASGGGVSSLFNRPAWQTGTGVPSGTKRFVPDVALTADPNYGAVVIQGGVQQPVGGTSWSSPTWAGFCALINQARASAGESSLGLLGPQIYPLLNSPDYPASYATNIRDIISGNNATSSSSGGLYAATTGYDRCTGLGAPLMLPLTQFLVGSTTLVGVQSPTPVQEIAPGQNAAFTVVVGGSSATYQWQRMPVGGSTWSNLSDDGTYSGSITATLTIINATTAMSGDQFQCLVNLGSSMVTPAPPSVLVVDTPLIVSTLAGKVGITGRANGSGTTADFDYPSGIAIDNSGNLYIADYSNNQIREITPTGTVSTPFGNIAGIAGSINNTGNSAMFNSPNGIAADSSNNLYVADTGNNLIRKIIGNTVSTLAGGNNVFNAPEGIAVDGSGNVYVADTGNNVIRKITSGGSVSILAGKNGIAGYADGAATTQALFNAPSSVAVDSLGNVYVADFGNSVVRKISSGAVTTVAGQAGQAGYLDGLGPNTLFNAPTGLAVDSSNNLYITDSLVPPIDGTPTGNNLVRKLTPAGVVSTIAGKAGVTGSANGTGAGAQFYSLQAIATNSGLFYLADTYNQTIRLGTTTAARVISLSGSLAFGNVTVNTSVHNTLTIHNAGNAIMTVSSINYPAGFSGDWSSGAIAAGGSQVVTVTFAPTLAALYGGNITVNSDATVGGNTIAVSGMGINAVTRILSLSGNLAFGGVTVKQTATATLTISNNGNAALTITSIGFPAGFSGDWKSGSIAANGSQDVTVTFAPTLASGYGGNIIVYSNATSGANTIAASGNGLALPVATTSVATLISATTATLSETVNPKGSVTMGSFQYYPNGTLGGYANATQTATQSAGSGIANVTQATAINALTPATLYHYRAVATNAAGTAFGLDKTFTTLAQPIFGSGPAAYLGASGAEVSMGVNPNGVATSVYFEYSTAADFSTFLQTAPQSVGSGKVAINVYALFPGLTPNTPYYYRMVTTSAAGTSVSDPPGTFTTLSFDATRVAQKGDFAVGASGPTFASFGNPAVNVNDDVAFAATLTLASGVTTVNDIGIWTDHSGTRQLIAQIGSSAPGTAANFLTLGDPVFNNTGAVAFRGTLKVVTGQATTTTATGIWSTSSGSLALVARQGSSAPGTGGTFAVFTSLGLSDSGGAIIYATLNNNTAAGVTAANNSGIWEGNTTGDLHLVLRLGQTVGGKTITKLTFLPAETYVNGQTRSFNSVSGDIICGATFSDKTTGIVEVVGGTPQLVAQKGDAAADINGATSNGTTFALFGNPAINTHDRTAFEATLTTAVGGVTTGTNLGIWADDNTGTRHLIVRAGSVAPGTTANFLTFSDPVYNDNEAIAFRATLKVAAGQATTTTATGIWCDSAGSLALVARQGVTQAPGCPAGATFATFTELALADQGGATNQGGVIFLATLSVNATAGVTTTNNLGIWAVDTTGTLQLIVRTGDILDGKTVTGLAFLPNETYVNGQSRSFDQGNGDLVFLATFSDKSTAIYNVVFP